MSVGLKFPEGNRRRGNGCFWWTCAVGFGKQYRQPEASTVFSGSVEEQTSWLGSIVERLQGPGLPGTLPWPPLPGLLSVSCWPSRHASSCFSSGKCISMAEVRVWVHFVRPCFAKLCSVICPPLSKIYYSICVFSSEYLIILKHKPDSFGKFSVFKCAASKVSILVCFLEACAFPWGLG